jgi:hypothetical protein
LVAISEIETPISSALAATVFTFGRDLFGGARRAGRLRGRVVRDAGHLVRDVRELVRRRADRLGRFVDRAQGCARAVERLVHGGAELRSLVATRHVDAFGEVAFRDVVQHVGRVAQRPRDRTGDRDCQRTRRTEQGDEQQADRALGGVLVGGRDVAQRGTVFDGVVGHVGDRFVHREREGDRRFACRPPLGDPVLARQRHELVVDDLEVALPVRHELVQQRELVTCGVAPQRRVRSFGGLALVGVGRRELVDGGVVERGGHGADRVAHERDRRAQVAEVFDPYDAVGVDVGAAVADRAQLRDRDGRRDRRQRRHRRERDEKCAANRSEPCPEIELHHDCPPCRACRVSTSFIGRGERSLDGTDAPS